MASLSENIKTFFPEFSLLLSETCHKVFYEICQFEAKCIMAKEKKIAREKIFKVLGVKKG